MNGKWRTKVCDFPRHLHAGGGPWSSNAEHPLLDRVLALVLLTASVAGCGKGEDGIARKAGETIGQQVTDFTKGVGKGIDQQLLVQVSLSPEAHSLGLTNTIAKSLGMGAGKKGISVYLIASQSISNTLVARALTPSGVEIGRARAPVVLGKDDAAYVTFEFEDHPAKPLARPGPGSPNSPSWHGLTS